MALREFKVIKIKGDVALRKEDGSLVKLAVGDVVLEGDVIVSGNNGDIQIENTATKAISELKANMRATAGPEKLMFFASTLVAPDDGIAPIHVPHSQTAAPNGAAHNGTAHQPSASHSGALSSNNDSVSFVMVPRIKFGADHNLEYGRDVNLTTQVQERASTNPRVHFSYNESITEEHRSLQEEWHEADGGRTNDLSPYGTGRGADAGHEGTPWSGTQIIPRPVPADASAATNEDTSVTISPLENYGNMDKVELTPKSYTAQHGAVTFNADGTFSYTPSEDYNGVDTIHFVYTDKGGRTYESDVNVTVKPVADVRPDTDATTEDTSVTTDVIKASDTTADGHDTFGPHAKVTSSTNGEYGTTTVNPDGTITYTPNQDMQHLAKGEQVTDHYTYTVTTEGGSTTETTDVTITITGTNDVPVISAVTGDSTEDANTTVSTTDSLTATGNVITEHTTDPDTSDSHTIIKVDGDAGKVGTTIHGTYGDMVVNADGTYTYTLINSTANVQALAENETHNEVFSVTVSDGHGGEATQDITITVHGTNDAPTTVNDANSIAEDAAEPVAGNVITNDSDVDNGYMLSIAKVGGSSENVGHSLTGIHGSVTVNVDGTYSYALNNSDAAVQALAVGETLTDTFSIMLTDEHGAQTPETLTITITGTNDAPTITGTADTASVTETDSTGLAAGGTLTLGDVDLTNTVTTDFAVKEVTGTGNHTGVPDSAALKAMFSLAQNSLTNSETSKDMSWAFNSGTNTFDYLAKGEQLQVTYTITAKDSYGATTTHDVTVTVTGTNDSPDITATAAPDLDETNAILTASGSLPVTDVDITDTVNTSVTGVEVSGTAAGHTGQPDAAALLNMLSITNPTGTITNTGTSGDINWTFNSGAANAFDYLAAGEKLVLTYTVKADDQQGVTNDPANYASGGEKSTDTSTVTITITGTNDAPKITADSVSFTEDTPPAGQTDYVQTGNILSNDTDADHNAVLTVTKLGEASVGQGADVTANGTYGTLKINSDGTYTYTLSNGSNAVQALREGQQVSDTFTLTVTDDKGTSVPETFTVNVTGANDAPVISVTSGLDQDSATLTESSGGHLGSGTTYSLTLSDVDVKDAVTTAKVDSVAKTGGTYTGSLPAALTDELLKNMLTVTDGALAADGTRTGAIHWAFDSGSETFSFLPAGQTLKLTYNVKSTDNSGAANNSATHPITVTITGSNEDPVLVADTSIGNEDVVQTGNVLTNDTNDPDDGEKLTVTSFKINGDDTSYAVGNTATIDGKGTVTVNTDGTWTFTPVHNYHGSVPQITYTTTNGVTGATAYTGSSTLDITVTPVADAPTLTNVSVSTNEDTSVALGLKLPVITDTLNDERLGYITLSGIDKGVVITKSDGTELFTSNSDSASLNIVIVKTSGGTDVDTSLQYGSLATTGANVVCLTKTEYEELKVMPADQSGKNIDMTLTATSYEMSSGSSPSNPDAGASASSAVHVEVAAVTDNVDLQFTTPSSHEGVTVLDTSTTDAGHLVINEDSQINLTDYLSKVYTGNDVDGSEVRTITLSGLQEGAKVNGATIDSSGTCTIAVNKDGSLPAINFTPAANYSGTLGQITATLSAHDTDNDTTITEVPKTDSITLDIAVNPVADAVTAENVSTAEDTAVQFLKDVALSDNKDGSESITGLTVKSVPSGWKIYYNDTLVHTGSGTGDNYVVDHLTNLSGYTILPPGHSSADGKLAITVETQDTATVNGTVTTVTKSTDLSVGVTVTPVAETLVKSGDTWTTTDTNGDGTVDLTMCGSHTFSTEGKEDTWFSLTDNTVSHTYNMKTGEGTTDVWTNQDTSEVTYALLTPVLKSTLGSESSTTTAKGATFEYSADNGTTWTVLTYDGTNAVKIPIEYLDTVQFKAPENVSGNFEITVQAYTVDTDENNSSVKATATSGNAVLSNIIFSAQADGIETIAVSQAKVYEDTYGTATSDVHLDIRPTCVDPSEAATVTIDNIPVGSTIKYDGKEYTATTADSGNVDVSYAGGTSTTTYSVTISNFDTTKLFIKPPVDSNTDFDLHITAVSVDGNNVSAVYPAAASESDAQYLTLHVDVIGVADDVEVIKNPVYSTGVSFTEAQAESGISIKNFYVKSHDTTDNSETVTMKITGLADGFSLTGSNVKFLGGTGTSRAWLVTNPGDGDILTTPANFSGSIKLSAQAVNTENDGDSSYSDPTPLTLTITPTPEATINTSAAATEDVLSKVGFGIIHQHGDDDETLTYVDVNQAQADGGGHVTLYYSAGNGATPQKLAQAAGNVTGVTTETIDGTVYYHLTAEAYGNIYAKGAENWSGQETLAVKYAINDSHYGDTETGNVTTVTDATYTVNVTPVSDTPTVDALAAANFTSATATIGDANNDGIQTVQFNVDFGGAKESFSVDPHVNTPQSTGQAADNDGSEQLIRIEVSGVPDGVKISDNDANSVITYMGDTDAVKGLWVVEYNSNQFSSSVEELVKSLTFTIDPTNRNLFAKDAQNIPITIKAVTQDSATVGTTVLTGDEVYSSNDETFNLNVDFANGPGTSTDIPAPKMSFVKGGGTIEDSASASMSDFFTAQFVNATSSETDKGEYRFSVTVGGLPTGTKVNGAEITGNTYTISGFGDNDAIAGILKNTTITLPKNYNQNNGVTNLSLTWNTEGWNLDGTGDTPKANGSDSVSPTVTPVTDPMTVTTTAVDGVSTIAEVKSDGTTYGESGAATQIKFNVNLANGNDGTNGTIVNGKLYLKVDGVADGDKLYQSNSSGTQTELTQTYVTGVSGVTSGKYYVLDNVSNEAALSFVYQPAAYHSGTVNVTASLLSHETGAAADDNVLASDSTSLTVTPYNSGYDLAVSGNAGNEGTKIDITSTVGKLVDTDGSEKAYSAVLSGFSDASKFMVYYGDAANPTLGSKVLSDGKYVWSVNLNADGSLPKIYVQSLDNYSHIETLTLTVISGETSLFPSTVANSATFTLKCNPVSDGITDFDPTRSVGDTGSQTALNINGTVVDTDGSETVSLKVSNLGDGVSFFENGKLITGDNISYAEGAYTLTGISADDLGKITFLRGVSGTGTARMEAWTVDSLNGTAAAASASTGTKDFEYVITAAAADANDNLLLYQGDTGTYDGLGGNDTLYMLNYRMDTAKNDINFSSTPKPTFSNIETIDLSDGSHNLSGLTADVVKNMTDSNNTLTINGGVDDAIALSSGWTKSDTETDGYWTYTNDGASLRIADAIANVTIAAGVTGLSMSLFSAAAADGMSLQYQTPAVEDTSLAASQTVTLNTEGTFDFSTLLSHVDTGTIDMTDPSPQSLTNVTPSEVYNITGSDHTLSITGTSADSVSLLNSDDIAWSAPTLSADGDHYTYTATGDFDNNALTANDTVTLKVDHAIYDDTLTFDASKVNDGGIGNDTLTFGSADSTIDMSVSTPKIANIEKFDLSAGDHTINNLTAQDVLDMTASNSSHVLTINGDAGDHVNLADLLNTNGTNNTTDGSWNATTSAYNDGTHSYTDYSGTSADGTAVTVRIEDAIIKQLIQK